MAIDWSDLEDAIFAWVQRSSGLAATNVIWSDQNAGQPVGDYITLRLGSSPGGAPDELQELTDLGQTAGQEIELRSTGVLELSLSVQAFTGGTTGDLTARTLLSRVRAALGLPSYFGALNAAGLSVFERGQIGNITALVGTDFQGRGVLDVRFYAWETASERTGYIASVETVDLTGNDTMDI